MGQRGPDYNQVTYEDEVPEEAEDIGDTIDVSEGKVDVADVSKIVDIVDGCKVVGGRVAVTEVEYDVKDIQ